VATLPEQVQSFLKMVEEGNLGDSEAAKFLATALTTITDYVEDWIKDTLLPEIQTYVAEVTSGVISVFKGIFNFLVGIIVAVYVMMIQETLQGQAKKIVYAVFKPRYGNIIVHTVRKSSEIFGGFISGKLLDSAIIGAICYVVCLILKMPSAMLVSVIIGVTNVIPFFGPIIGAIPSLLLVVIQSPWHALYLLIFIIILQQVDGNIIGPKILGNSTGLSSFWVMFAILVFGGIWGFFGMLLGVPIFAVIYYIIGKVVRYGLRKRKLPEATSEYIEARGVYEDSNTLRYPSAEETEETEET
jgi:predicted PurR-regulated permease PerM